MKAFFISVLFILFYVGLIAQDRIPDSSGFGGYVLMGPGVFNVESNILVTGPPLLQDAGHSQIASIYDVPKAKIAFAWPLAGEINYTFNKSRTQLFFGNRLEDILRLDVPFGLGVRQELEKAGILALSLLFTPAELKFWADPYVEGEERYETDLNFRGYRIRWGRIFNTGLQITATMRWYQYKYEKSGDWLIEQGRLEQSEKNLLIRDGQIIRLEAMYQFDISKRHSVRPAFKYILDDHNGASMANEGYSAQLTYLFFSKKIVLDANIAYGKRIHKAIHPIYNETLESQRLGAAITAFIPIMVRGNHRLLCWITGEYFNEESNVDFFDSQFGTVMFGIMYQNSKK